MEFGPLVHGPDVDADCPKRAPASPHSHCPGASYHLHSTPAGVSAPVRMPAPPKPGELTGAGTVEFSYFNKPRIKLNQMSDGPAQW